MIEIKHKSVFDTVKILMMMYEFSVDEAIEELEKRIGKLPIDIKDRIKREVQNAKFQRV